MLTISACPESARLAELGSCGGGSFGQDGRLDFGKWKPSEVVDFVGLQANPGSGCRGEGIAEVEVLVARFALSWVWGNGMHVDVDRRLINGSQGVGVNAGFFADLAQRRSGKAGIGWVQDRAICSARCAVCAVRARPGRARSPSR